MPDAPALEGIELPIGGPAVLSPSDAHRMAAEWGVAAVLLAHRRLVLLVVGGMVLACLGYCLVAPRQYEARARIALRATPTQSLNLDGSTGEKSGSFASGEVQLETLASVLRSDQLAREVIAQLKLDEAPGFNGGFQNRFPGFRPDAPDPAAEAYLEQRFAERLHVVTLPRTLVVEIRFRCRDPYLSAAIVNALIRAEVEQDAAEHRRATGEATGWLRDQLEHLRAQADRDDRRLAEFQKKHRILVSPETLENGAPGAAEHVPVLTEVDALGRELAAADAERMLREVELRASERGDPEAVLDFDARAGGDTAGLASELRALHARHGELEQELAQLSIERGPNFPRMVEVRKDLQDLDRQLDAQRQRLREQIRGAWEAAEEHAALVRRTLEKRTAEGLETDRALEAFEVMRRESNATRDLYLRMQDKVAEASLTAGTRESDLWIVDGARPPAKPVVPNPPLYLAVTLFGALWTGVGAALLAERMHPRVRRVALLGLGLLLLGIPAALPAQAPTPSTSGLPTGVARIPESIESRETPNAKEAPPVWNRGEGNGGVRAGLPAMAGVAPLAAPIGPGDLLDVSEFHTPEFHSVVRVSASGTIKLPLVDEVGIGGMDEQAAAKAIADALVTRGMLNHPQVFVMVTAYAGQDVSVLGEVARPGVYPYGVHHRLLDLISAASGVTSFAGGVVNVYHRNDPATAHPVELNGTGAGDDYERNPELAPGDIIEISRAGLVYVVGDVIRPGGFVVDPAHQLTVLKALSLAWGPSQNAALGKAILIREQDGGRAVTNLNLKRMLRGQDPDEPVRDHDILFVPNSTAKNLFNRSVESAIQSAAGVSIYAGMVYSQRF